MLNEIRLKAPGIRAPGRAARLGGTAPRLLVLASPVSFGQVNTRHTDFVVAAEGGVLPYRYELVGEWPEGLTVHPLTGRVWGAPAHAGTFANLRIRATDARGTKGETELFQIKVLPENVAPLDPNAASVPPTNGWGTRKLRPAYAGNAGRVRNSANAGPFNVTFDADGIASQANLQAAIDANGGVGGTSWGDLYDQYGTAHFTSTVRPSTAMSAHVNRAGKNVPAMNWASATTNMITSQTPVNFDEGKCVTVFVVARTMGWSSAGTHARNPAVYSNANGPILGYGSSVAAGLIYGAYGSAGETTWRTSTGITYVEDGTPDDNRLRVIWYRYANGKLSAGIGNKLIFADRPYSHASFGVAGAQRLVLGAHGNQTQAHNGHIHEVIMMAGNAAPTIEECMGIAAWQLDWYGDLAVGKRTLRNYALGGGQSLMQFYGTAASFSGSGTSIDYADYRVFRPHINSYLNPSSAVDISVTYTFNSTAIGGSALYNTTPMTPDASGGTAWAQWDGSTASKKFWWDQFNNIPGPCLQSWRANAIFAGSAYNPTVLMWDQGQADALSKAGGETANDNWTLYDQVLEKIFNQQRAWLGQEAPILIQPYGRQSGVAGVDAAGQRIREVQRRIASRIRNVFIGTEMCDLTRQDSVHPAAGPADPNGFDLAIRRLARGAAYFLGVLDIEWRGPEIVAATLVSSTTIDLEVDYPEGCGGTDIVPTTGIVGFVVTSPEDVARVVTSAARIDANTIRITGSGFVQGDLVDLNTTPVALDRTKMPVSNFDPPMPMRQAWDVRVAA